MQSRGHHADERSVVIVMYHLRSVIEDLRVYNSMSIAILADVVCAASIKSFWYCPINSILLRGR